MSIKPPLTIPPAPIPVINDQKEIKIIDEIKPESPIFAGSGNVIKDESPIFNKYVNVINIPIKNGVLLSDKIISTNDPSYFFEISGKNMVTFNRDVYCRNFIKLFNKNKNQHDLYHNKQLVDTDDRVITNLQYEGHIKKSENLILITNESGYWSINIL